MSQPTRTLGTLAPAGSGKNWNRFHFTPVGGGPVITICKVLAFQSPNLDHSKGAFALLGIITAFPDCQVMLTQHHGPGEGVVAIECSPDHCYELPTTLPDPEQVPKNLKVARGTGPVCTVQPIELDSMPIYRFQAFTAELFAG